MRIFVALLLVSVAVPVFAQNVPMPDPVKTPFDNGVKFETAGRLAAAKLMFTTLAATYEEAGAPLVERGKSELAAIYMFMEAQSLVKDGKTLDGFKAFRKLMRIFPESPLAKLTDETSKTLGIPPNPRW